MAKVDWSQFTPVEPEKAAVDWSQFTPVAEAPKAEPSILDRVGDAMNAVRDFATGADKRESVLQGVKLADPEFDPAEAERLSRRAYAEQTVRDQRNLGAPSVTQAKKPLIALRDDSVMSRAADLVGAQVDSYSAGLGLKAGDALSALGADSAGQTLRNKGLNLQERADRSQLSVALNADGAVEKYAPQILAVFPTMAVAAATGGLPVMFGISEVQSYAEGRKAGLSPLESLGRAVPMGAAEVIGEKLGGTGKLIDALESATVKGLSTESLKNLGGKFLAAGAREVPSEEATYAMQFGIDKMPGIGLKQDATAEDFVEGAKDTAIVALGAGGAMAGAGAALSSIAGPTAPAPTYDPAALAREKGFLAPPAAPKVEDQPTTPVAPVVQPKAAQAVDNIAKILAPAAGDPIAPTDDNALLARVPVEGADAQAPTTDAGAATAPAAPANQPAGAGGAGQADGKPAVSVPNAAQPEAVPAANAATTATVSQTGAVPAAADPRTAALAKVEAELQAARARVEAEQAKVDAAAKAEQEKAAAADLAKRSVGSAYQQTSATPTPLPGAAPSPALVGRLVQRAKDTFAKNSDLTDTNVYPEPVLYGIINSNDAGPDLMAAARQELGRRRGTNAPTSVSYTGTLEPGTTSLGVGGKPGSNTGSNAVGGQTAVLGETATGGSGRATGAAALGNQQAPRPAGIDSLPLADTTDDATFEANQKAVYKAKKVIIKRSVRPLNFQQKAVSKVARMMGKTVTWIERNGAAGEMPDGFINRFAGEHIFLDVNSDKPFLEILMHEGTHALPAHIREKLKQVVLANVSAEGKEAFLKKYGYTKEPDFTKGEEVTAFVTQRVAANPEFFQDLRKALGNKDFAELAKVIISKIKNWFQNTSDFDAEFMDKYVTDVKAVHDAAVEAYADAMREMGMEPDTEVTGPAYAQKTTRVGDYQTVQNKDGSMTVRGNPEEIRALIPDGVQGRVTKDGLAFTHSDAPRVRHALEGNNTAYSRGGQVNEKLAMTKDGKYLGAPEKFNTPGKIPTLRKWLMKLTKEGEAGRYWYENSSKAILHMVGGDKVEARKFAALLAIYSPQAKVDTNGTFALRAWAQYKAGQPISVKTGVMDRKAQAALDNVDEFWSGEKTGNFVTNLLRMIDPELAQGATIDMWMMRAAQYSNDAPTKTQYAFMENETNRIARELGWEPQQVQAAIWVAMKARMENDGVKKAVEAKSEKRGWLTYEKVSKLNKKTGKMEVVDGERKILDAARHRDNWLEQALAYDPTTSDTQRAKFDFEDSLLRHIGQVSFEARPGRTSGVLPGIHDATYAQQLEFQNAVQNALYDEDGADMLAAKLGLMIYRENNVPGVWQGEVSPSTQKSVAMAPAKGDAGKGEVDEAQKSALNVYAAVLGLLTKQEGVGWHRPFYATSKKEANGVDIDMGRPVKPDETAALEKAVGAWMAENGKSTFANWQGKTVPWSQGLAFVSSPNGIRLINFGVVSNSQLHGDLLKAIDSLFPAGSGVRSFKSDGDMPENNWKDQPNGQSYISRISAEGRSDVLGWARTVLGERIQRVFDEYSEKYGWGDPGTIAFSNKSGRGAPDLSDSVLGGRPDTRGGARGRQAADGALRDSTQEVKALPGAPNVPGFNGPDPRVVAVAERYARDNGITLKRQAQYVKVDPERAKRIADAYAAMPHDPQNPKVKAAYAELIKQTTAQYKALEDAGYKFWFMDMGREDNQQYASSPWNAMRDMRANQEMGVFPTTDGFGSSDLDVSDNPLMADTGIRWPVGGLDGELKPVLANDLFRAVHDAFGHGLEGAGFRAEGEENAWQAHIRLFTGAAKGAITSETRGQNSWLNFGPSGDSNRTAQVEDTVFADQKTGLMPSWTWTEGLAPSEGDPNLDQDITLEIPVEGGKTAKLTINARAYINQLDAREDALRMVKECLT